MVFHDRKKEPGFAKTNQKAFLSYAFLRILSEKYFGTESWMTKSKKNDLTK